MLINGFMGTEEYNERTVPLLREGLKPKDVKAAEMVLEENKELAIEKWNEYFGGSVKNEDF